jgi:hypothetical protein
MSAEVTGTVHGNTITLDEAVPPLEGRRVRVNLEPLTDDPDQVLTADEQARLLREWAAGGPQGPLDAENEWPDESH